LTRGSKSFSAASTLLPRDVREAATVFYAFCRVADDVIDESDDPHAVTTLEARLRAVYAGKPASDPVDRALADLVAERRVPEELLAALIEGFAWDREGRRYETISEVRAYAARVAGSVGAVMTVLMGVRTPSALARACDLGVAMQLTNISRDVGEDARNGRVYLPAQWLEEAGVDGQELLARPSFSKPLANVIARTLREADGLYVRSELGIVELPTNCRASIWAARLIYADIGRVIASRGYDTVSQRASVSLTRKLSLLALAQYRARSRSSAEAGLEALRRDAEGPLDEVAFLVSAAADRAVALPETA
jgi:phytoene synthase